MKENKHIRPDWVPSAYRQAANTSETVNAKAANVKPATTRGKDISIKRSSKRRA